MELFICWGIPNFAANSVRMELKDVESHNSFNTKTLENGRKEIFDMRW